jgi:hypothetical protein
MFREPGAIRQKYRVVYCMSAPLESFGAGGYIALYRQPETGNSRFSGLQTCGSVWHCPVCAPKIAEARRAEATIATEAWVAEGGEVQLLTLTCPHKREMSCAEVETRFAAARSRFKNSHSFKKIMKQYGRVGAIRALEVTYGVNGWHPHTHELVFVQPGLEADAAAIDELRAAWVDALLKSGLGDRSKLNDMLLHAFDLRGGRYAAEYIAKYGRDSDWSLAHEATAGYKKMGMARLFDEQIHATPFQLLLWADNGDHAAEALFLEYGKHFHGKRALIWTKHLKTRFKIKEKLDEELAAEPLPEEQLVGYISSDQWKIVLSREARAELLEFGGLYCTNPETSQQDLNDFIALDIAARPQTHDECFY